jgi:hypothetical protein
MTVKVSPNLTALRSMWTPLGARNLEAVQNNRGADRVN